LISSSLSLYYASDDGTFVNDTFSLTFFDKNGSNELHIVGWVIGGFLVGFGTKLGNGCTSGHGICGLPRFSIRSWVAVPTFMMFGIIMATIRYYSGFLESYQSFGETYEDVWYWFSVALWAGIFIGFIILTVMKCISAEKLFERIEMPLSFFFGIIFGIGLALSGMCRRTKIIGFLTLNKDWDPSLMLVMVGGLLITFVTFPLIIKKKKKPIFTEKLVLPTSKVIDAKLILGAACFGLGWGISGLCPGPALIDFFTLTHVILWLPMLALGQSTADLIDKKFFTP